MAPEGAASRAPSANFVSTAAALDENADLAAARVGAELQSFGALLAVHRQLCPSFCARAGGVARSEPLNPLGPSGNRYGLGK